ncbi:uncharacterized protein im:7136021 [Pristis pectinata]|uniref:uncharacterized protein im:7136021 n=1 Tax=Pristis pectinata TaxID=685728 RepID=UPI00223E1C92|nr:uncharacterized protein im:7136021 [Pristis pectinata]
MAKVGQQWLNLPQDILLEVFRYLTFEEKANVRATCKYLQQLIDHPTLWLNRTIVLKSLQSCNSCFWTTLRKRRIRCLVIREATPKQLQKMVNLIPNLAAVSMDVKMNVERLRALRPLANLRKLQLSNSSLILDQDLLREVATFKQLTTLVLCSFVYGHSSSLCFLAELKKLQSLTLHVRQKSPPLASVQYILFRLPKLRELSLSSVDTWENLSLCFTAPEMKTSEEADVLEPHCISQLRLEKLSLLNSASGPLSRKALKQLSNVHSLSVNLTRSCVSLNSNFVHSMLENLPNITELELSWNGPFADFVNILPSDLIRIDLINARLSNVDVQLLSDSSGKTLKHLSLVLCSGITETMLKRLPKQFPFLQTLDLSGYRLLNQEILFGLVEMAFLKEIVISNNPHLTDTIKQFRTLTDSRVHVTHESKRNHNECDCLFYSQFLS